MNAENKKNIEDNEGMVWMEKIIKRQKRSRWHGLDPKREEEWGNKVLVFQSRTKCAQELAN